MFWQYNTLSTSQFETIFEKEDVTLSEVLDQENVIQECKNQTKKLIDFLSKPEILSELISLITTEPPADVDEVTRFKLPHVASEIMMCEVPQISSAICQDETLLEKLFSFMESESTLNPLLASFFTKAVGNILTRKSEQNWYDHQFICVQIVDFLKKKEFVKSALKHIGTSAITDLVLRLITCMENGDIRTGILEWLNQKELVQSIIRLIEKNEDRDTHDNAARLVIEILRVSRDSQYAPASDRFDDPLLNTLESGETVELLLKIIFGQVENSPDDGEEKKKDNEDSNPVHPPHSVIFNGISILLALLETRTAAVNCYNANQNEYGSEFNSQNNSNELSSEDAAKQEATLKAILDAILPWLPQFTELLVNPPSLAPMSTTAGLLDPPLGRTRLDVAKLICALLATNNKDINMKLSELGTINILLDLFFKYSLNNFLHEQVKECIRLVFAWNNSVLPPQDVTKSPTAIRVKTPPTVEMIDPQNEDIDKSDEKSSEPDVQAEKKQKTSDSSEDLNQDLTNPEKPDSNTEETKAENDSKLEAESAVYDNPLLVNLFTTCRLVDRVLEAWEENESEETKPGFHRKGYMGHLTHIANVMHQNMRNKSQCQVLIDQLLSHYPDETRDKWEKFTDEKLSEINERNKIIPPDAYANKQSSSDDEDADFKDVLIPHESGTTQLFSDYQMQKMSENFVDTFGFEDNEFNVKDVDDSNEMRRLTNVLSDEDATAAASDAINRSQGIFEAICDQRFTSFPGGFDEDSDNNDMKDDHDSDEDPWADRTKEISFSNKSPKKSSPNCKLTESNDKGECSNSSSDEEDQIAANSSQDSILSSDKSSSSPVKPTIETNSKMEVDDESNNDDEWAELNHRDSSSGSEIIESGSGSSEVAMDTGNPWDSKPLAASTITPFDNPFNSPAKSGSNLDEGWANFSSSPVTTTPKTLDEDSEMSPVKADFEAAFGPSSPAPVQALPDSTSSPVQASNLSKESSSPIKSPNVTTSEENIPSTTPTTTVPMQ